MWLRQADCGEEVHSAEVIQVDLGSLHGPGVLIRTTSLDIEVLHQGNASEERLASLSLREEFKAPSGSVTRFFGSHVLVVGPSRGSQTPFEPNVTLPSYHRVWYIRGWSGAGMKSLKLTSLMAENADFIARAIARYITERLDIPTEFIDNIPWQERERLLDAGQIHVGWICGLPYVWKADQSDPHIELLAAPVMQGVRYQNRPVYFSDVVVHRDSGFQTFANLRGASWAYNEPGSHSGYNVVRYHLATLGERSVYFGKVIESGAHQASLQMILDRQIDASAIDSTVLELEFQRYPAIRSKVRIIETLGPSPILPFATGHFGRETRFFCRLSRRIAAFEAS